MFAYQQNSRYFAQTAEGLEEAAAEELKQLGAGGIHLAFRGLFFEADKAGLYRVNYQSRLISRVLAPLSAFTCHTTEVLYRKVRAIPWKEIFGPEHTFAVFANLSNSKLRHSQYAALCVKDAVVDGFREDCGRRPDVARIDPDVWIGLFVDRNRAVVSLDTSGGSLHRRGYRQSGGEAPMQETVAAAVIRASGWDGARPLYDPMCGSGTLLSEALIQICRIPAGCLRRRFGFERLPDFDRPLWESVKRTADRGIRPLPAGLVAGSDIAPEAVAAARENNRVLPYGESIDIQQRDCLGIAELGDRVIVCNPPYGIRLKHGEDLGRFYKDFGDFLKQRCRGSEAFVYFGNREMLKHIGLRPAWRQPLRNGGLDGRLAKFDLY